MEVFLVYKQFCNIKDVLSKPYDKLTYEDHMKMYDPLFFTLEDILDYEIETDDNEQEGGFFKKLSEGLKQAKAARKEVKKEISNQIKEEKKATKLAKKEQKKQDKISNAIKKSEENMKKKEEEPSNDPGFSAIEKQKEELMEKADEGTGPKDALGGFKKMLQNLIKILIIVILIAGIPLFPWLAIIYYTWGRLRTLYIRTIQPM